MQVLQPHCFLSKIPKGKDKNDYGLHISMKVPDGLAISHELITQNSSSDTVTIIISIPIIKNKCQTYCNCISQEHFIRIIDDINAKIIIVRIYGDGLRRRLVKDCRLDDRNRLKFEITPGNPNPRSNQGEGEIPPPPGETQTETGTGKGEIPPPPLPPSNVKNIISEVGLFIPAIAN